MNELLEKLFELGQKADKCTNENQVDKLKTEASELINSYIRKVIKQ